MEAFAATPPGGEFEVVRHHVDYGACVLTPIGALDTATVPRFKEAVIDALARGCRQLVVDVTNVTALDSTAVALLALAKKVRLRRGDLVVVCPDGRMASRFARSGFTVFAALEEAAEHLALDALHRRAPGRRRGGGRQDPRRSP
jgi:anti-anti-sigma factor